MGSFKELAGAESMQSRLNENGHSSFYMEVDIPEKGVWYRVYLGKYSNKEEALLAAESAKFNERLSAIVHQVS